ncbi:hypothetical protein [Neobacillus sp. SuZ13]|uniref:hypothetical protein n=1 Tax=Neobacillus sp. SuZ13 TaxID=3047875 RepID=UPI0024C0CF44|nr:hypothetical protein [Neobacillus sp. SuZ13]WHY64698.1 hypothetical protein QNH17_16355 [Neobacillus sp. SuZ13]
MDNEVTIDKTFITKDEFNKMFKIDTEEEQFNNGKFQLKDNSIVKADYLSYGENDLFDYALAVFYNGKLASIQIETSKSQEELEKAFGIKFGDKIEPYKFGYEITFDKMFHESNISIYPNEWQ